MISSSDQAYTQRSDRILRYMSSATIKHAPSKVFSPDGTALVPSCYVRLRHGLDEEIRRTIVASYQMD